MASQAQARLKGHLALALARNDRRAGAAVVAVLAVAGAYGFCRQASLADQLWKTKRRWGGRLARAQAARVRVLGDLFRLFFKAWLTAIQDAEQGCERCKGHWCRRTEEEEGKGCGISRIKQAHTFSAPNCGEEDPLAVCSGHHSDHCLQSHGTNAGGLTQQSMQPDLDALPLPFYRVPAFAMAVLPSLRRATCSEQHFCGRFPCSSLISFRTSCCLCLRRASSPPPSEF